jgi:hypothetical protein
MSHKIFELQYLTAKKILWRTLCGLVKKKHLHMKQLLKQAAALLFLATGLTVFSSFTSPTGGECFEIHQDGKLVLQRCGKDIDKVQTINLSNTASSELTVKYFHCGQPGKDRVLALKTNDGVLLKEWKFTNTSGRNYEMTCGVKEILSVTVANSSNLKLYYTSAEKPEGKLLAVINTTASKTTMP